MHVQLQSVTKVFGQTVAVDNFEFEAGPGEIIGITGPSGVGKTTICRMISGIETPTSGRIMIAGQDVTALPAHHRGVAQMFESYALYPHMRVSENIRFPLVAPSKKGRLDQGEIHKVVDELLELTEIAHLRDRRPSELSGGQKQRVALCRALVQDANVYVLDEPISHLDAKLRNQLRGAIRRRQTQKPVPTIWTSPDAMETLSIADRVAVLSAGKIQQFTTGDEIYLRPATTEVARLIGDPAMNLLDGRLTAKGDKLVFESEEISLRLPDSFVHRAESKARSREVVLGLRPNGITILNGGRAQGDITAQVYAWEPFGKYAIVTAELGSRLVRIKTPNPDPFKINETIAAKIDSDSVVLFDKELGTAI